MRAADRKIGLRRRGVRCFNDARDPPRIEHQLSEMLAQRIYGLALGYEDVNDHEELRNDELLGMLAGKRDLDAPLAGKSTLNRLELTPSGSPAAERYRKISYPAAALDELLAAGGARGGQSGARRGEGKSALSGHLARQRSLVRAATR